MNVGTIVVNEVVYPVSRIELAAGLFRFWVGPLDAPVALPTASEAHIHAPDGSMVMTAPWALSESELAVLRRARLGDTVSFCLPVSIVEVIGWPRSVGS